VTDLYREDVLQERFLRAFQDHQQAKVKAAGLQSRLISFPDWWSSVAIPFVTTRLVMIDTDQCERVARKIVADTDNLES
jgi:hypothetical protein